MDEVGGTWMMQEEKRHFYEILGIKSGGRRPL
jgi:hypothetical protein